MFVDIENFKGALTIENLLTPYKKGRLSPDKKTRLPKEPITREVCMEVLQSTNYARNIKDMLLCIAELPQSEQAQFKDVVLATFSNREQPDEVLKIAEKLAQTSGYLTEFYAEPDKIYDGRFLYSANSLKEAISTTDETMKPEWANCGKITFCGKRAKIENQTNFPPYLEFFQTDNATIENSDLRDVKSIYFRDVKNEVHLEKLQNLTAPLTFDAVFHIGMLEFDFSKCPDMRFLNVHDVSIHDSKGLPEVLDVSSVRTVSIYQTDLMSLQQLKLNQEHSGLSISRCSNLPDNMWVQNVTLLDFVQSSWRDAQNLNLKNIGKVNFDDAFHLPQNIKLQKVSDAYFPKTDFGDVKSLWCEKMMVADLGDAQNLPPQMVFRDCEAVSLRHCDLTRVTSLDLRGVRKNLFLDYAVGLPKIIDKEKLNYIFCKETDFNGVEKIRLHRVYNVDLSKAKNLSAEIDIAGCEKADLSGVDFKNVPSLKLSRIQKEVNFSDSSNLPRNLALAHLKEACFSRTRFGDTQSLKLKNIETVIFQEALDTPKMIVLQGVNNVRSHGCDFSKTDTLFCRKVNWVNLGGLQQLPKKMVFEDCDEVWLGGTNGENLNEIEFENVKRVYLYENKNYPKKLDFSKVEVCYLDEAHFSDGTEVIFRNRRQMLESDFNAKDTITVRFADEEEMPLWKRFRLKKHSR